MFFALSQFLVFGLLIWLIVYGTKKFRSRGNRLIKNLKGTQWIVAGYLAMLFITVPIIFLLSMTNPALGEEVSQTDVRQFENDLSELLLQRELEEATAINRSKNWQFEGIEDNLVINAHDNYGMKIFVEEIEEVEAGIDVTYFFPMVIVNELDISHEIHPMKLNLIGNTLTILPPEETELKYAQFEMEFPIKQFFGEGWMSRGSSSVWGADIIYIKMPSNVKIELEDYIEIVYVN